MKDEGRGGDVRGRKRIVHLIGPISQRYRYERREGRTAVEGCFISSFSFFINFILQLVMLSDDRFQIIKSLVGFSKIRNPQVQDEDSEAFIPTELDCECDFLVHFIDFEKKVTRVGEGTTPPFRFLILYLNVFFLFSYIIGGPHDTTHGFVKSLQGVSQGPIHKSAKAFFP